MVGIGENPILSMSCRDRHRQLTSSATVGRFFSTVKCQMFAICRVRCQHCLLLDVPLETELKSLIVGDPPSGGVVEDLSAVGKKNHAPFSIKQR